MVSMLLPDLLQQLGYEGNPNFLTTQELHLDPEFAHVYRRAQTEASAGGCSLKGVYRLRAEPFHDSHQTVPVVYVCEAQTDDEAREIHKRVWNQSIVPFLIVSSPRFVRLYSGFKYARNDADSGLLLEDASAALRAFSSSSIDNGQVWTDWGHKVTPETRVDWRLLENLKGLDEQLGAAGISDRKTSHALIGKFVYLRYLKDRDILSDRKLAEWGLRPGSVFSRKATLREFNRLLDGVQEWLNGEIFPIPDAERSSIREGHVQQLAATFYGDDPVVGQLSLFNSYDFSFIPIETLSIIYEQFLHSQAVSNDHGAYYTPLPIVSFMVEKLEQQKPLRFGTRVVDPSCGSGAFLVYTYRKLIEKTRLENGGVRPKLSQLRDLLVRHIFGVDVDSDACSVAELSLILTLLDYANPPDLSTTTFKLPSLRGRNIFEGDFFDESGPWFRNDGYDWVIGNPPWVETRSTAENYQYARAHDWMVQNKSERPTGGNQVAEAFAWRSLDVLRQGGVAGLLMPAMTLFKHESKAFRRTFFATTDLWSVANFSNLAEVLFAGRSRVPAAAMFFAPRDSSSCLDDEPNDVEVYSPLVANAVSQSPGKATARRETWSLVVDASEIRDVSYRNIEDGESLSWKLAAWGSEVDRRLLRSVERRFSTIGDLERQGRIALSQGLELRAEDSREATEHHPELAGQHLLDMEALRRKRNVFSFPDEALKPIPDGRTYARKGRFKKPEKVCRPPHVIVSAGRTFAVFSDQYIVVPPRQVGIASSVTDENTLKALSLFLNSDFVQYHQFFHSSQAGVKRERTNLADLRKLPMPLRGIGPGELKAWVDLHTRLVGASRSFPSRHDGSEVRLILRQLNEMTDEALGLSRVQSNRVHDFVQVKLELRDGKTGEPAVSVPSDDDLTAYAEVLCAQLDDFLGNSVSMWHKLVVTRGPEGGMVEIDLKEGQRPDRTLTVLNHSGPLHLDPKAPAEILRKQRSQWLYFRRNLRLYQGTRTYLFKPMQRFHWTRSQAVDDAAQIIAETLISEPEHVV